MAKVRAWWGRLSPAQRTMVAIGVPVVAIVALITSQRREATPTTTAAAGPAGVIPGGVIIGDGSPVYGGGGGGGGDSQIFEVVRSFESYVSDLESSMRSETDATHATITQVADALMSDSSARQEEMRRRLEESEAQAAEREKALEDRIAARDVGPSYTGREAVVANAYRNVLGREPDAAGLRYWVSSSLGYEGIAKALANTAEGRKVSGK